MKKVYMFILLILLITILINFNDQAVKADVNDYTAFASINVTDGKLLRDYSSEELKSAYELVSDRKFVGWRYHFFQRNVQVDFISNVVFSMYNSGTTALKYKVQISAENCVKTSISCTETIKYDISGTIKKFKNGLDSSLKLEGSYQETQLVKQQENLEVDIDPGTVCIIYIQGSGLLTNGVASYYEWWFRRNEGGFEYFTITDSHLRIEKIKV